MCIARHRDTDELLNKQSRQLHFWPPLGNIHDMECWYGPGVRQQCLQQSRSIVETEFLGGDSSLSSATLEMLEDEMMTEVLVLVLTQTQAQASGLACSHSHCPNPLLYAA